jgi:hypothetical protein
MTDRGHEEPPARPYDDRTRDITLPPLPDRPPPALPREWVGRAPSAPVPDTSAPDFSAPPPDTHVPEAAPSSEASPETIRASLVNQPTDELRPGRRTPREPTLSFSEPEMVRRPIGPVQVDRAPRRWPWVVLVLLPILVITGAGIALFVVLGGW